MASFSRLVGLAQAARPLAGGSADIARGRAVQAERSVAALTNNGHVWYENEYKPKATPSRSEVALHLFSCQHQIYGPIGSASRRNSATPRGAA
jgi:hypothetical protein